MTISKGECILKVIDLINQINKIGYDENTELTFSFIDGDTGEWYDIPFRQINYGEDLTGETYHNDAVDLEVDVPSAKEYLKDKFRAEIGALIEDINEVFKKRFN